VNVESDRSSGVASTEAPSARRLATASVLALLGALLLLVVAVLPAEYGVDPLGTGRMLGLSAISAAASVEPVRPPQGQLLAPERDGPMALYPGQYKVDSREFTLGPYEYLEYKYRLENDATMLFSWKASGDVVHDFHGDHDGGTADAPQSYDKKPRRQADGSFTAPFSGIHGWFWENPGGESVTIQVTTAGFYTEAWEFNVDRTRHHRQVMTLDVIPGANQSKE
jgi:hypothetical protein